MNIASAINPIATFAKVVDWRAKGVAEKRGSDDNCVFIFDLFLHALRYYLETSRKDIPIEIGASHKRNNSNRSKVRIYTWPNTTRYACREQWGLLQPCVG